MCKEYDEERSHQDMCWVCDEACSERVSESLDGDTDRGVESVRGQAIERDGQGQYGCGGIWRGMDLLCEVRVVLPVAQKRSGSVALGAASLCGLHSRVLHPMSERADLSRSEHEFTSVLPGDEKRDTQHGGSISSVSRGVHAQPCPGRSGSLDVSGLSDDFEVAKSESDGAEDLGCSRLGDVGLLLLSLGRRLERLGAPELLEQRSCRIGIDREGDSKVVCKDCTRDISSS